MLGHKRNSSIKKSDKKGQTKLKHKSTKEKLKNFNKQQDEEIASDLDEGVKSLSEDEDVNNKENNQGKIRSGANSDEVRLRLAKKLLSKMEEDIVEEDQDVDNLIREEIKKEKHYQLIEVTKYPNFNPHEQTFLKGHLGTITSLDISSDSKTVVTCSKDRRGIRWDLESGKKFLLPQFTKRPLNAVIFTPDEKYALFGGVDRNIYQVDLHNEKVVQTFRAHNDVITGLISDTNKDQFYSISKDHTLKVWASSSADKSVLLETFYGHTSRINDIDILPGETNKLITCGSDNLINLWKVDSQSFLQYKLNDIYPVDCIKSLNPDVFLTGGYDGSISIWKSNKKRPVFKQENSHGNEKSFTINHDFYNYVESERINIPRPILSLGSITNSDLVYSGSSDGVLNIYGFNHKFMNKREIFSLTKLQSLELSNKGCINVVKANKNNEFLVVGNGKDSKLGRWDSNYDTKIGITIVKLFN